MEPFSKQKHGREDAECRAEARAAHCGRTRSPRAGMITGGSPCETLVARGAGGVRSDRDPRAGTEAAVLLDFKVTVRPAAGAGPLISTVPVDCPPELMVVGLIVKLLNVGGLIVR